MRHTKAEPTLNVARTRELIEINGRTRRWLAEKCGISLNYLNLILVGERSPRRPIVKLLAQALDVSEDDLFTVTEEAS